MQKLILTMITIQKITMKTVLLCSILTQQTLTTFLKKIKTCLHTKPAERWLLREKVFYHITSTIIRPDRTLTWIRWPILKLIWIMKTWLNWKKMQILSRMKINLKQSMQTKLHQNLVLRSSIQGLNQISRLLKQQMKQHLKPHFSNIQRYLFGVKTETDSLVLTLKQN